MSTDVSALRRRRRDAVHVPRRPFPNVPSVVIEPLEGYSRFLARRSASPTACFYGDRLSCRQSEWSPTAGPIDFLTSLTTHFDWLADADHCLDLARTRSKHRVLLNGYTTPAPS